MEFSTATHKVNHSPDRSMIPFLRWKYPKNTDQYAIHYAGEKIIPELILVAVLVASLSIWHRSVITPFGLVLFLLWTLIVGLLFTLAITNLSNGLLPNKFVYPMGVVIVLYQLANALHVHSIGILGSAILGGIILGGVPYLLYQISAGRWIGGGDVKVGFYGGLLIGWKLSLVTLVIIGIAFGVSYCLFRYTKLQAPERYTTGTAWAGLLILCMLFGQNYIR